MIHETSLEINDLYKSWLVELESRHARRNRVRYIDRLLNQLELLNLSEAPILSTDLRRQLKRLLTECEHPLARRSERDLTIAVCMEALYDIQDTLMPGGDEEAEER
ncbi:MAG TPA: hypothetical protein VGR61_10645 [Candidatus Dormibacteraeota bacterium]|nr:hypothetical protein [Candidatus Dormibacteraeota bacterium]